MKASAKNRSPYWDIAKGIGIIAIVLGHSCYFAVGFVYLFHMALFFFVSGYLYSEKKYGDAPFLFFGNRFAGMWPRYVFYTSCFVLMHNFFVTRGLYAEQEIYNHTKMLTQICTNISLTGGEQAQGALWFIPVWLAASGLFGGAVWFGRTASQRLNMPKLKVWLTGVACAGIGLVGLFLNMRQVRISYNLQTSYLVVPIYFFAYLLRSYCPDFKKYTTWYGCIVSAAVLYYLTAKMHIYVLLDEMNIPGAWFYVVSLIGIYFALSLAAIMEKLKPVSRLLSFLGSHSFEIMAIHFAVFKITDYVYAKYWLRTVPDNLSAFPASFPKLWPVYLLAGTLIPACIGLLVDWITRSLMPKGGAEAQTTA